MFRRNFSAQSTFAIKLFFFTLVICSISQRKNNHFRFPNKCPKKSKAPSFLSAFCRFFFLILVFPGSFKFLFLRNLYSQNIPHAVVKFLFVLQCRIFATKKLLFEKRKKHGKALRNLYAQNILHEVVIFLFVLQCRIFATKKLLFEKAQKTRQSLCVALPCCTDVLRALRQFAALKL